jgi:hypothetical protein
MESIEGLVCYFINLGYKKCIKQFVIPKLYNKFKLVELGVCGYQGNKVSICEIFHVEFPLT